LAPLNFIFLERLDIEWVTRSMWFLLYHISGIHGDVMHNMERINLCQTYISNNPSIQRKESSFFKLSLFNIFV